MSTELQKKSITDLVALCKEKKLKGYSGKKKADLIAMLSAPEPTNELVPVSMPSTTKLRTVDLFAGTGAFTLAFEGTGKAQCVFANDMVEWSKTIYDKNFGHPLTLKDLHSVKVEDIPAHDILTGGFPCFVAGTLVLTNTGYKPIESVELTDKLMTHTGKYQQILNKQIKTGANQFKDIHIQYHPHAIRCTDEHPFYVRERIRTWNSSQRTYTYHFGEPKWLPASELTTNHYSAMPINTESVVPKFTIPIPKNKTASYTETIELNTPDQWFMMGYFLGDGWVQDGIKQTGQKTHTIRFAINNKDEEYVKERISKVLPITDKKAPTGKCNKFGCNDIRWYTILKEFGKYAHGKAIPEWVQSAPKEFIREFLKGYQNADGYTTEKIIQYTTVSEQIAFGIQRLYLKLGILCSVTYHKTPATCIIQGRVCNQRPLYLARIRTNPERNPSSLIETDIAWMRIKSVSSIETEPQTVYNFEVEHDNSYCVENSIVHNCQPFSIAGKQDGFQDDRANVFWKILEILDHHTPRAIVLENVKNLVSHDGRNTFQTIKTNLEGRGYHLTYKVLDTAELTGIPQHRERIYIVGLRDKSLADKFNLNFPKIPKQAIASMLQTTVPDKYYYKESSSTWPLLSEAVKKRETIYQYRRVYVRENKSNECPTLTANMGGGGHNVPIVLDEKGIRKLTPRECFNFQGFPQTYTLPSLSDTNLYKLAGNAVSVPVVRLIAERLVPLLEQ